jgi:thioredoxin
MRLPVLISVIALLVTSCMNGCAPETRNTPPPPVAAPTNTTATVQITKQNYDELVRSQKVVLILFWAPWSAPDRAIAPIVDAVSKDYSGRVRTGKVNVDENPELSSKFKIKAIPTVVVLKDGSEQERIVGVVPKKKISDLLDKQLH